MAKQGIWKIGRGIGLQSIRYLIWVGDGRGIGQSGRERRERGGRRWWWSRFFGIKILLMKSNLVIREVRILLEESVANDKRISLKVCVGTRILKIHNLSWNPTCHRWETTAEIKLEYQEGQTIDLELYYPSRSIPTVLGEASIDLGLVRHRLEEELKIALTYDGLIKGWLYCQIGLEGRLSEQASSKLLYIHKISFFFMEDYEEEFEVQIFQNSIPIYYKTFFASTKNKTLFPNLKQTIRYSDVIRVSLLNRHAQFKTVDFLIDSIKRGKTTYYEAWIRNQFNSRAGDFKCEYFLENLFLDNERKVVSRKPVYPDTLTRMSSHLSISRATKRTGTLSKFRQQTSEYVSEASTRLTEKDENTCEGTPQSKGRSFRLIQQHNLTPKSVMSSENSLSCLKKVKTGTAAKLPKKEPRPAFYFQNPLE